MVYCGKPSRGCQMCRTRRIKCDETKPTCLQCQKSRRQCPGYKDDFDLVFRNETQATERRARRAVNKKGPTQIIFHDDQETFPASSGDSDHFMTNSDTALAISFAPSQTLSVPVEQQAPCFFLSNYVLSPSNRTRGHFDFLAPMMRNEPPDSQLSLAFSAVATASLANRPSYRGRGLMQQALAQYTKALKATNLALQNPAQQKSDQTLAAILMLTFFETLASEKTNAGAWFSHVDGAVQLVRMRGKKQLRTKVGQALFHVVRQQMTTNCMASSKPPLLGADWWCADAPKEDYGVFISRLNITICELRSEINIALNSYPRTPEYSQKVLDLMRRAQAMEKDYLRWEETLPDYWYPKTVAWVDNTGSDITKAEVCPGKVDVYQDIWYANIWNHARIVRLYISGAIVRCAAWICSPVDYRTTPEYATATRLCVDLVTDIIASIPLHLGWRIEQGGGSKVADLAGFPREAFATPDGIGALFAMWPLFSISNTDYVTDSQRAWVKGRLIYISEAMGFNHAKVLAGFQLRLPSMIIRRDNMGHSPPTAQMISAAVARGVYAPRNTTTTSTNPTTTALPIHNQNNTATSQGRSQPLYTMNPLQQREAMQREAYEKERASLLKKSSNGQGDVMERLAANYLAV